jgi:NAD(P)-dependent dehydrogenase (short-subunit alcohol dehydrogenase family)
MVALVTGGGRGIGRRIALRIAKEGSAVSVAARSANQLAETVAASAGKVIAVAADVADPASVRAMVREVQEKLGPVTLLVNNAGTVGPLTPFWENDPEEWWRCQEVNLRGPMLCCHEIVPGMMARKQGRILNVSSGAGCRAVADMGSYVVSKTALIRFSEQLALELAPHGISVFPIRPGIVRTAMLEAVRPRVPVVQKYLDEGMDVTPEAVAELVLFLASGRADQLSGRLFSVKEDVEEIVRRAEDVRRDELYTLRVREL